MAAILEATFQVLAAGGDRGLTTTRVAERAGVSVGTLYQYFPNRQGLVVGLLTDHLDGVVAAVADAAEQARGASPADAVSHVVRRLLAAKAARVSHTRILHAALGNFDDRPLVRAATARARLVVADIFTRTGTDAAAAFERAGVLCAALEGVVTSAIADEPAKLGDPAFVDRVVGIATALA